MKVFLDTNVWVAASASHGLCRECVTFTRQRHQATLSEQVLEEFFEALTKKLKQTRETAAAEVAAIREAFEVLKTPGQSKPRVRDPKDDAIVQAALDGDCDWLVSGDKDLCVLVRVEGMPITTPRDFLEALGVEEEVL